MALHKWLKEGLNVGTHVTAGAQYVLEAADYYLGGSGGSGTSASVYSSEEGVREAYSSLSREFDAAVHHLVAVPLDQYQKHGAAGYLSSLASGVPLAILRPIIGVTEGVTKTLIGVQKWVDPSLKEEIATKFKKKSLPRPFVRVRPFLFSLVRHLLPFSPVWQVAEPASTSDSHLSNSTDMARRGIDDEEGDALDLDYGAPGGIYFGASLLGSALLPNFTFGGARHYPVMASPEDTFSDEDSQDDSDGS